MTAQDKFYARLKELGLDDDYDATGDMVGTVLDDGRVVVLIHYEWESGDPYTEITYPSYEDLWKNENFRRACKEEYYTNCDGNYEFIAKLAMWLDLHKDWTKCPLFPCDLYWLPNGFETSWRNFEDDATAEEIIKNLVAQNLHSTKQ